MWWTSRLFILWSCNTQRFSEYSFALVWVSHPFLLVTGQGMKFLGSRIYICSLELLKMVLLLCSPSRSSWVSVASSLTRLALSSSFLLLVSWYLLLPSAVLLWVCFLLGDQILCSNDCSILNLHQQWVPAVCSLTRPWCVSFSLDPIVILYNGILLLFLFPWLPIMVNTFHVLLWCYLKNLMPHFSVILLKLRFIISIFLLEILYQLYTLWKSCNKVLPITFFSYRSYFFYKV